MILARLGTNLKIFPNLKKAEPQTSRTAQKRSNLEPNQRFLLHEMFKFNFGIGMNLKISNVEPTEPRFVFQNQTSNLLNLQKKTEPQTRFVPSFILA